MSVPVRTIRGYTLHHTIDEGGFAIVYRAVQLLGEHAQRDVAIKVIKASFASEPEFIRRFEAEAQLVARLEHPRIVPLIDFWREPSGAYLVMRWMQSSLADLLYGRRLPTERIATIFDHVAEGLAFAHRRGVVHRDIKPANILLDAEQNVYLADFGIAKDVDQGLGPGATLQPMYTPGYSAPEQIQGAPASPQADIYSLGVLLYELLAGVAAFPGETYERINRQLKGEPLQLVPSRPDLPPQLERVVQRATALAPADRYPDVAELALDVRRALAASQPLDAGKRAGGSRPDTHTVVLDLAQVENPYKGLHAFQEADADDFFGRAALVELLLQRLVQPAPAGRFLPVIGPSGSGKSSVVRAGLLPALRRGALPGSERWFLVDVLLGSQPVEELARALLRVASRPIPNLTEVLCASERGLTRAVRAVLPADEAVELVLVIDQFEELFTQVPDLATRAHVLSLLHAAVSNPAGRLRVVLTMRADFMDDLLLYPEFGALLTACAQFVLPLGRGEIEEAIRQPAARAGVAVAPELVEMLVRDVDNQPGALPLLQYALYDLFDQRQGRALTFDSYHQSGGVLEALSRRAELLYDELGPAHQEAARQVFLRLVTLGEGNEDTRRRVCRHELLSLQLAGSGDGAPPVEELIHRFGRARLLTFDRDPVTRAPTVEVAHETLLRTWRRLRGWLDDARADVRQQRRLAEDTTAWVAGGRDRSYLATGLKLDQLDAWERTALVALSADERAFLDASRALRAEELGAKRRARQRRWVAYGALLVAMIAVAGVLAWLWRDARSSSALASRRADETRSAKLAFQARSLVGDEYDVALAMGVGADRFLPSDETRRGLLALLTGNRRLVSYLRGHSAWVRAAAFSPDGRVFATAGDDHQIFLWDSATSQPIRAPLTAHSAQIHALGASTDGLLASGDSDGRIILWDIASGEQRQELEPQPDGVKALVFSPDGKRLAVVAGGGTTGRLWVWDTAVQQGREITSTADLEAVAWNRDGSLLAAAINASDKQHPERDIALWDASGEVYRLERTIGTDDDNHTIFALAFSPDENHANTLVAADSGGDLVFWALGAEPTFKISQDNGPGQITSLAFNSDGTRLAAASANRLVTIWDVEEQEIIPDGRLAGHASYVKGVAFSPVDTSSLVSVSADTTAAVWNLDAKSRLSTTVVNLDEAIYTVDYSDDGRLVAAGSAGGDVVLWDPAAERQVALLNPRHSDDRIYWLDFAPSGTLLAAGDESGFVYMWDLSASAEQPALSTLDRQDKGRGGVNSVAFSPDGRHLAAAYDDGKVVIWDVSSGTIAQTLPVGEDTIWSLAYNPTQSTQLAVTSGNTVQIWDTTTGKQLDGANFWMENTARVVAFSPDGRFLAAGGYDIDVYLWDARTYEPIDRFSRQSGDVWSLAFSPDGNILASGGDDRSVVLWDLGEYLRGTTQAILPLSPPIYAHDDSVYGLAFSPDGKTLVSGGADSLVQLWNLDPALWQSAACAIIAPDDELIERLRAYGVASPAGPLCGEQLLNEGVLAALAGDQAEAEGLFAELVAREGATGDARLANTICWNGATLGFAATVLPACERAVALQPGDANLRDSRGLARAVAGDLSGAAEDFTAFVAWASGKEEEYKPLIEKRQAWIVDLTAGTNPFDEALLRSLYVESVP